MENSVSDYLNMIEYTFGIEIWNNLLNRNYEFLIRFIHEIIFNINLFLIDKYFNTMHCRSRNSSKQFIAFGRKVNFDNERSFILRICLRIMFQLFNIFSYIK